MSHSIPTIFIIFGATGDLMERKIVPSLFYLYSIGRLPEMFHVIGFARKEMSDEEFQEDIKQWVKKFTATPEEEAKIEDFLKMFRYHQGDFGDVSKFESLSEELGRIDGTWQVCANKLYHLAVPPMWYETIAENLEKAGLHLGCGEGGTWTRIMIEKPFGRDLKTAQGVQICFGKRFNEKQMYRIDHYLGKGMIQDILAFRFSNTLFGGSWDNEEIESIHIQHFETVTAARRGGFYESVGALRDMGQSHLLSMLAFLTMDHPVKMNAENIRSKREEILSKILPIQDFENNTIRAQYNGYHDEQDVALDSKVETYFKVRTELDHPKWKGVPIILEHGKALGSNDKKIVVTFKRPENCLMCSPLSNQGGDSIVFSWDPHESITIHFLSKKPGLDYELEEKKLYFSFREGQDRMEVVEGYSKLIVDAIEGDQTFFLSQGEIEASWKVIDPIEEAWERDEVALGKYSQGTTP